jgi:hypothetical protein
LLAQAWSGGEHLSGVTAGPPSKCAPVAWQELAIVVTSRTVTNKSPDDAEISCLTSG